MPRSSSSTTSACAGAIGSAPVTLAYLYWEPSNARDVAACAVHAAELQEFAGSVSDPRLRFIGMSYSQLWSEWAERSRSAWLRAHVAVLRKRYDVPA